MIVADAGALTRCTALSAGPRPDEPIVVAADVTLAEYCDFLRVYHDGRTGPMLSSLAEAQMVVFAWYPIEPITGRLARIAADAPDWCATAALAPIALAASLALPFVTTSPDLAEIARAHTGEVRFLGRG